MYTYQILKWSFFIVVLFSKCDGCSVDNAGRKPVIAALLDLHTGDNCEIVKFHGLQQSAILRSTLEEINALLITQGIEIKLLIFDTCSTTKGTITGTLNALVASEQTCINTPFFLGFIGNENKDGLEASQRISNVFNIVHVVPHYFDLNFKTNNNALFVSSYPIKLHTKAVKIIFEKLGIQNFIIVHENLSLSIMKMNHLVADVKDDLCLLKSVMFLSINDLNHQLAEDSNEDALLIIIEDVNILDEMEGYIMKYNRQVIISAGKVGAENLIFPLLRTVYILQFVSSSPLSNLPEHYDEKLVKRYDEQQLLKCLRHADNLKMKCNSAVSKALNIKEKDWTVELLQYGLMLYGQAVRNAADKKCNKLTENKGWCPKVDSMSQKEWQLILKNTYISDDAKSDSSDKQIKFNMDINGQFVINLLKNGSIRSVGKIKGSKIEMVNDYNFPTPSQKKRLNCRGTIFSKSTTTTLPTTIKIHIETSSIPLDRFLNIDFHDYEMIGILSGIIFGIVFLLGIFLYVVYSTVRIKSARSDSSSIGSVNTRGSD